MKRLFVVAVVLSLFLAFGCGKQEGRFVYSPEKPQQGQEIVVKYHPAGTNLEGAKSVEMLAYQFFGPEMPTVVSAAMKKDGGKWTASFTPADSAVLVAVNFRSGETVDNNDRQGYFIELYDDEGNVASGTKGSLAYIFYSGAYPLDIKTDRPKALSLLNEEFAAHPEMKDQLFSLYLDLIVRTDRENGKDKVKAILDSIEALPEISLKQKELLASWYNRVGEQEKSDKYYQEVVAADPTGTFAEMKKFREFRAMQDVNEKIAFYKKYVKDFPEGRYADYISSVILKDLAQQKQFDAAENFISSVVPKPTATMYNSLAWDMVQQEINLNSAAEIAKKGVELARKGLEAPVSEKPSYLTEADWRKQLKTPLGNVLDTYGFALYKLGNKQEALPIFKEAVETTDRSNGDVNQRYAQTLLETGNNETALNFLKELIPAGLGFPGIEDEFKKAYVAVKGSDEGADELLAKLQKEGKEKLFEELKKEMLDLPASDFTLVDMNGDSVSLKDLRGKIVITDFWATWCGPCKASFPAMQKAVDKFKDDPDVQFLFINTWERGENVKEHVAKFIKDHGYTFHVLFDLKNEVVSAFGVEGIPTKFIIDKKGKIRFKSVGFGGDEQKLVDELSSMIEMLK
ncbi:MAG: redoxin domain-containing protein [Calditrichaeota bacterium]|nr:redoxin domain-containing protein [Calditrichota bacterium]